jgi:hypothetical protein
MALLFSCGLCELENVEFCLSEGPDTAANLIGSPGVAAPSFTLYIIQAASSSFLKLATRILIRLNAIPTAWISFETLSVSVTLVGTIN